MTEKTPGIYCIKNKNNNKVYIGSTSNLRRREKQHFDMLKFGKHINKELQRDYNAGDQLEFSAVKNLPLNNHNLLITEEANTIKEYQEEGIELYNVVELRTGSRSVSKQTIIETMANLYCKNRFGMSATNYLCNLSPSKYDMIYEIITSAPEEEQKIRAAYEAIIKYENEELYKSKKQKII